MLDSNLSLAICLPFFWFSTLLWIGFKGLSLQTDQVLIALTCTVDWFHGMALQTDQVLIAFSKTCISNFQCFDQICFIALLSLIADPMIFFEPVILPLGWWRRIVRRVSGNSAGKFDVYYFK